MLSGKVKAFIFSSSSSLTRTREHISQLLLFLPPTNTHTLHFLQIFSIKQAKERTTIIKHFFQANFLKVISEFSFSFSEIIEAFLSFQIQNFLCLISEF